MRRTLLHFVVTALVLLFSVSVSTLPNGTQERKDAPVEFPDFDRPSKEAAETKLPEVYVFSEYSVRWYVWDEGDRSWMPVFDSKGAINPCEMARLGAPGYLIPAKVVKKCGESDGTGDEYQWLKSELRKGE
jgi:hypothetical protein